MSHSFPPELDRMVQAGLATGAYASENDLLLEAMQALQERNEALTGIREGLCDLEQGRVRPLREVDDALRTEHRIPRDA